MASVPSLILNDTLCIYHFVENPTPFQDHYPEDGTVDFTPHTTWYDAEHRESASIASERTIKHTYSDVLAESSCIFIAWNILTRYLVYSGGYCLLNCMYMINIHDGEAEHHEPGVTVSVDSKSDDDDITFGEIHCPKHGGNTYRDVARKCVQFLDLGPPLSSIVTAAKVLIAVWAHVTPP